jgi:hypothetical protein
MEYFDARLRIVVVLLPSAFVFSAAVAAAAVDGRDVGAVLASVPDSSIGFRLARESSLSVATCQLICLDMMPL